MKSQVSPVAGAISGVPGGNPAVSDGPVDERGAPSGRPASRSMRCYDCGETGPDMDIEESEPCPETGHVDTRALCGDCARARLAINARLDAQQLQQTVANILAGEDDVDEQCPY